MHVQLLVPRLLDPVLRHVLTPGDPPALAALELLFARGRRSPSAHSLESWLQQAYGLDPAPDEAAESGLAALGMQGDGLTPGTDLCAHADPVHLRVNPDGMALTDSSLFAIAPDEAQALMAHLNTQFTGRLRLEPGSPTRWYARVSGMPPLHCATLDEVRGGALGAHLPHGAGGRAWQALLNEVQMLLHRNSGWVVGSLREPDIAG